MGRQPFLHSTRRRKRNSREEAASEQAYFFDQKSDIEKVVYKI